MDEAEDGTHGRAGGALAFRGGAAREPAKAVKPHRQRHDGFTPKKQRKFFRALRKCGCLSDAARVAGVSRNTVRRHRDKWPAFDRKVEGALAMASVDLDMIAWQRAVEGAPEIVIRDGKVASIRIKPSDSILRLLMQGANPEKYGRIGGFSRRSMEMRGRGKRPRVATNAEVRDALEKSLVVFAAQVREARQAEARALGEPAPEDGESGE